MRAIKRSIAQARAERAARDMAGIAQARAEREARDMAGSQAPEPLTTSVDSATCEHVTRELTARIDLHSDRASAPPSVPRHAVPALRCEPCPRVIPSRRLLDGSVVRRFRCSGTCERDDRRARDRESAHDAQHAHRDDVRAAARYELRVQLAITGLLALLVAMWIVLGTRDASADPRPSNAEPRVSSAARRVAADSDDDDDAAIDIAAPPTRDAPFAARVDAPPIAMVLAAAYRTAGLDHAVGSGLVRRSRLAGLVPWLSVRTGRDTNWRDDDPDIARGLTVEVRATWRLDRLVFDGRELQVAALDGARRRERRRLATRVIQVYFAWKRSARAAGLQPSAAAAAEEAAAELDDLTDGWFSQARTRSGP